MTGPDEDLEELRLLAHAIFAKYAAEVLTMPAQAVAFDETLWQTLAGSGLTLLSTPESSGGSGAGVAEMAAVLAVSAEYAAPVPLAETDLLAAWLLVEAGLDVPVGPLTFATGDVSVTADRVRGVTVAGTLERVPWAQAAEAAVVLGRTGDTDVVLVVPLADCDVTPGHNLAHEPRDGVRFRVGMPADQAVGVDATVAAELELRGALARAAQTCGALDRALSMTIEHATARVQFGRPIARFQAVQHLVAEAASEATAARAACDVAIRAVAEDGFSTPRAELAVALAKSQTARAAGVVSRVAHQVHGAIGVTLDHQLRHFTLRALAWRDEFGDERRWERRIGDIALASGANGLWAMVTSGQPTG